MGRPLAVCASKGNAALPRSVRSYFRYGRELSLDGRVMGPRDSSVARKHYRRKIGREQPASEVVAPLPAPSSTRSAARLGLDDRLKRAGGSRVSTPAGSRASTPGTRVEDGRSITIEKSKTHEAARLAHTASTAHPRSRSSASTP